MKTKVTVAVLWRDPKDLTLPEVDALRALFPKNEIVFAKIDPKGSMEYEAKLRELKPVVVIMPPDYLVISDAIDRGTPHILLTHQNTFADLKLQLEKFKPSEVAIKSNPKHELDRTIHTQAASYFGLSWDEVGRVYVNEEGVAVRNVRGEPFK